MRRARFGVYWPALEFGLFVAGGEAVWLHRRRALRWVTPAQRWAAHAMR